MVGLEDSTELIEVDEVAVTGQYNIWQPTTKSEHEKSYKPSNYCGKCCDATGCSECSGHECNTD